MDETDLSAQRAQTSQNTRVSQADVDQGWPRGDPVAPGEGTPPAFGVSEDSVHRAFGVGRVRSHRTFEALRKTSRRGRSGPISVSFIEQPSWSRAEMAFAIHRRVGTAVVRNRVRRRVRAVTGELAPSLPIGAYVVHIGPGGPGLTFDELKVAMSRAMERATSLRTGDPATLGRSESQAAR